MKRLLILSVLLLAAFSSHSQTNVLYGYVKTFGLLVDTNVSMELDLLSPINRTWNGVAISNDPIYANESTNGYFSFTNVLWGKYKLRANDGSGTSWTVTIPANLTNAVPIASYIGNAALPPDPATNYYTQAQVDALISGSSGNYYTNSTDLAGVISSDGKSIGTNLTSYATLAVATNIAAAATNNPDLARYSDGAISNGQSSVVLGSGFKANGQLTNGSSYIGIQSGDVQIGNSSTGYVPFDFNGTTATYAGNGSGLTNLSASQLTTGTIPDARLSSTVMHTNGSANLITGTGADSGLSPSSVVTTNSSFQVGTNVLVIAPDGNDTLAVANPYKVKWKTAYDLLDTNNLNSAYGAITVAKPGDWIYFTPSSSAYQIPVIPLNGTYAGGWTNNNLNLYVPLGATVNQADFNNTNATGRIHATGAQQGTFVFVGNNSEVVINGTMICTNYNADGSYTYTEMVGFQVGPNNNASVVGLTNYCATNFYCHGSGWMYGISDGYYFSSQYSTNPFLGTVDGPHVRTTWDTVAIFGADVNHGGSGYTLQSLPSTITFGPNCDFQATWDTNHISRAINAKTANLIFNGGKYVATGSSYIGGDYSSALCLQFCNVQMNNNPVFIATGVLTNILAIVNPSGFNNAFSVYSPYGLSFGSFISGGWTEVGGYGQTYGTALETNGTFVTSGMVYSYPTNQVLTNSIILWGGGLPLNSTYIYNSSGGYTNVSSSAKYITNNVSAGAYYIVNAGVIKCIGTNFVGSWVNTNSQTGTIGTGYTNFIGTVRQIIF